jgi:mono/diheme cytochrome c family protein/uncharacterized cupredoxin-like copper-binding protein
MTNERTGRELEPRKPDRDEVVVRETPTTESVERFYAGDSAHTVGLTEERAAQIVRQSGNARSIAFLATLLVVLFIPIYWFYDLGFPALAGTSRLEAEKQAQVVTDVGRGYALFVANCARCHSSDKVSAKGDGGIGPPLNDQGKLYNAVTSDGKPGTGHLNPTYIHRVLEVGGRLVCGDPKSVMPAWLQPSGPLNYREVEELIAFITASKDLTFTVQPAHAADPGATLPPVETHTGWRDPNYKPAPDATPVPDCWRPYTNPAFAPASPAASAAPVTSPGTAANPRIIKVDETGDLRITDDAGAPLSAIAIKKGETVTFQVTNKASFPHDFYIGPTDALKAGDKSTAKGTPDFAGPDVTQSLTYTFDQDTPGLGFGCILPGHFASMNGTFQIQP